jgi:hypothetical protein
MEVMIYDFPLGLCIIYTISKGLFYIYIYIYFFNSKIGGRPLLQPSGLQSPNLVCPRSYLVGALNTAIASHYEAHQLVFHMSHL